MGKLSYLPMIIDKFGAINVIRLSTYSKIFDLKLFSAMAILHASFICHHSASVKFVLNKEKECCFSVYGLKIYHSSLVSLTLALWML